MFSDEITKNFSTNLKRLREGKKLTQKELGNHLGYSEKTIAKWESGTTISSVKTLVQIADFFKTDISNLVSNLENEYILGVDAGGTKTHYMLCDTSGNVVKELIGKGCNSFDIGMEGAIEILKNGLDEALLNIPPKNVTAFVGIAGGGPKKEKEAYGKFLSQYGFSNFENDTDNRNIIAAGLGDDSGISIILGTGICLYEVINGKKIKKSGWGYLVDEGGSAYNFGIDAIKAYYNCIDGWGEETKLCKMIEDFAGCSSEELLSRVYSGGKKYIASFSPLVFECAEKFDDKVSKDIIKRNFSFVAKIIDETLKDFGETKKPVKCVIAGGVSKEKNVVELINNAVSNPDDVEVTVLNVPQVLGAVKIAREIYNLNKGDKKNV